jgi:hypothetical protein
VLAPTHLAAIRFRGHFDLPPKRGRSKGAASEVKVTFAEGVKGDVAELTEGPVESEATERDEIEALKLRIAELLVECKELAGALAVDLDTLLEAPPAWLYSHPHRQT